MFYHFLPNPLQLLFLLSYYTKTILLNVERQVLKFLVTSWYSVAMQIKIRFQKRHIIPEQLTLTH